MKVMARICGGPPCAAAQRQVQAKLVADRGHVQAVQRQARRLADQFSRARPMCWQAMGWA